MLPRADPLDIASIRIEGSGEEIRLVRGGYGWSLESPVRYPADAIKAESLLEGLLDLASTGSLNPEPEASYGLDPPRLTVTLQGQGRKDLVLEVGDRDAEVQFVRLRGSKTVEAVERNALGILDKGAGHWRDLRLLPFDPSRIVDFRHQGEGILRLSRSTGSREWTMVDPAPGGRLDDWAFARFLQDLGRLRIQEFGSWGTEAVQARWEFLLSDGAVYPVVLSGPDPDRPERFLARLGETETPAAIPSAFVRQYRRPHRIFRSPFLLDAGIGFDRIGVEAGERYQLALQPSGKWLLESPEVLETDPRLMGDFVRQLAELRIEEFVSDSRSPSQDASLPSALLSFRFSQEGADPVLLRFHPYRDRLFLARRSDEPRSLYAVSREQVLQLPDEGWKLRQRRLWDFGPGDVAGIRAASSEGGERLWRRTPEGWLRDQALLPEVEGERLEYHLARIFEPDAWILRREGETPLSSLIGSHTALEIEHGRQQSSTLLLGPPSPGAGRRAATLVGGFPTLFEYAPGHADPLEWILLHQ